MGLELLSHILIIKHSIKDRLIWRCDKDEEIHHRVLHIKI